MPERILKPCPFCGGKAIVGGPNIYGDECIECSNENCGCRLHGTLWNTRDQDPSRVSVDEDRLDLVCQAAAGSLTHMGRNMEDWKAYLTESGG